MVNHISFNSVFSQYSEEVFSHALELQRILLAKLPGITEQIDIPARMVAYCYGHSYVTMICTLIPSKKGLKLGFYKGSELPDPHQMLEGTGKISRYVEIKSMEQIQSQELNDLIDKAFDAYQQRVVNDKKK